MRGGSLAGGFFAGEREPDRVGGWWRLDGASHGAARAGEGEGRRIAERPSDARRKACGPERSAEAREGSQEMCAGINR